MNSEASGSKACIPLELLGGGGGRSVCISSSTWLTACCESGLALVTGAPSCKPRQGEVWRRGWPSVSWALSNSLPQPGPSVLSDPHFSHRCMNGHDDTSWVVGRITESMCEAPGLAVCLARGGPRSEEPCPLETCSLPRLRSCHCFSPRTPVRHGADCQWRRAIHSTAFCVALCSAAWHSTPRPQQVFKSH